MQKPFREKKNNLFFILLLILLGCVIYSNTFFCSFHFDDIKSITENPSLKDISALKAIWDFWPTRFLTYISLALNYHFHRLNVFGYHLVNLLIHLCSGILVWWLALLTFSAPVLKEKKLKQNARLAAFFTALIFVTHPLGTQSVTYIVQRAVSLASLFYLLSLCLYIKSRLLQQGKEKSTRREGWYYLGSLLAAVLAMFTKEMTITLPFMILLYENYFLKEKKMPWKTLAPFLAALVIIPITMALTKEVNFAQMHRVIEVNPVNISLGNIF